MRLFVDVILPLALPKLYTYHVAPQSEKDIALGKRVVVEFSGKKAYTALVRNIHSGIPEYETKEIISVLDEYPLIGMRQFELWDWIASYYMCSLGEVMAAALPSALKLQSETKVVLNSSFINNDLSSQTLLLSDKESLIAEVLKNKHTLNLKEISKILEQKTVIPIIKSMMDKGIVLVEESLVKKYKPLIQTYITLTKQSSEDEFMKSIFERLEKKAPKQLELLMTYLKLKMEPEASGFVLKSKLLEKSKNAAATLHELVRKNILEIYEMEIGRHFGSMEETLIQNKMKLNTVQQSAYDEITHTFGTHEVALLHGVTSSGKTEIYIHLIQDTLAQGKQVLYLLPEIALTTQIISRLKRIFGDQAGVYHSKFNDHEKAEVWNQVKDGLQIILGARSAVFLPFSNLGLVIVDEEHENSYKQFDPAPRYHARDTAIYLAHIHKAKTLLGSATPSLESYYNAQQGKYGLINVNERFGGMNMPEIIFSNVAEETRKKLMKSHFSDVLLEQIKNALDNKEQIILFQNRRGFAPYIMCVTCGWTPHCKNCDVSLTYHKQSALLRCHYCGYSEETPSACPACGDTNIRMMGFGTEKIEDELQVFFPDKKIARLDLDSTRSKYGYENIIHDFEQRRIDILVGTQMVTKGLDFDHVSTVGIMNADNMLKFPDFRAFERSFQLMAQVSGRSGRKNKKGKVIIQTFNPNHPILNYVLNHDYKGMYTHELAERKIFQYPPFYRLIEITLKHQDVRLLTEASDRLAKKLKNVLGSRVLGPEFPLIPRIKNLYLKNILLKIERELSVNEAKKRLADTILLLKQSEEYRPVRVHIDVDPM